MEKHIRIELLLKEYELCQDHIKHVDNNIWTTSGIVGLGSIGSLILSSPQNTNILEVGCIGLLVMAFVWIWWHMASRWWDLQHSAIIRMRHIEEQLSLYRNRYVQYLDQNREDRVQKRRDLFPLAEKYIDELIDAFPDFRKGQVKGAIVWLPRLVTIIWIGYFFLRVLGHRKVDLMQILGTMNITNGTLLILGSAVLLGGIGIGIAIGLFIKSRASR